MVDGVKFEEDEVHCDVPQESVLGPSMFGDYSSAVKDIYKWHKVSFQIYVSFSVREEAEALKRLELCIYDFHIWMAQNYLNLNDDKTDYIILGSKIHFRKSVQFQSQ